MANTYPKLHKNSFNQETFVKLLATILAISLFAFAQSPMAQTAAAKSPATAVDDEERPADVSGSVTYEYQCEMKDVLTIYMNKDDNDHLALRWKSHIYRMHRVATSTGANRFENTRSGYVWIGIPSKGMLLDSHKGQQLTNDCKTTGQ